jgi:hypothetical protein
MGAPGAAVGLAIHPPGLWCHNRKKVAMSFPSSSHHQHGGLSNSAPSTSVPSCSAVNQQTRQGMAASPRSSAGHPLPTDGEHQLEKLQFALAIALTRGDTMRSSELRDEIAKLGGNREEPGT